MTQQAPTATRICIVSDAPTIDWSLFAWVRPLAAKGADCTVLATTLPDLAWFATHGVMAVSADSVAQMATDPRLDGRSWDIYYFASLSAAAEFSQQRAINGRLVVQAAHWELAVLPHLADGQAQWAELAPLLAQANRVVVPTKALRDTAVAHGAAPQKIIVVPPGVDEALFQPAKAIAWEEPVRLVTAVSFTWQNGLEYLLQGIRLLVDGGHPLRLAIIGRGRDEHQLRYLIDNLNLTNHVQLLNPMPGPKMCEHFQKAHLYLQPSLVDAPDQTALEAMACGLPVVALDGPNWREWLTPGQDGWLLPARQPALLAQKVAQLCQMPVSEYERMRQAARRLVEQKFSLSKTAVAFLELFQQLGQDEPAARFGQQRATTPVPEPSDRDTQPGKIWLERLKSGLWWQRIHYLPGTILPKKAGEPDQKLPDLVLATIAVGELYVCWALALIETVRGNGRFQGPILLITDQPERFGHLVNVQTIRVPATSQGILAKQYKTWLPFLTSFPYTLFLDADVLVGRPLTTWFASLEEAHKQHPLAMFFDGGHFHEIYHTGVILYNKALAKPILARWRRALQSGRFQRDQTAFMSIASAEDILLMEPEHFIFPDIHTFRHNEATTFNHITVTDLQRSFARDIIANYLQQALQVTQLPYKAIQLP
ncbi:MAG: glycosyltransferase family 4 protein [Anaerolineales bacterium]|nr:glycosyltransferase family 4 protein [Anaerolineales bacterium]